VAAPDLATEPGLKWQQQPMASWSFALLTSATNNKKYNGQGQVFGMVYCLPHACCENLHNYAVLNDQSLIMIRLRERNLASQVCFCCEKALLDSLQRCVNHSVMVCMEGHRSSIWQRTVSMFIIMHLSLALTFNACVHVQTISVSSLGRCI
jgi:hypothetical protein